MFWGRHEKRLKQALLLRKFEEEFKLVGRSGCVTKVNRHLPVSERYCLKKMIHHPNKLVLRKRREKGREADICFSIYDFIDFSKKK